MFFSFQGRGFHRIFSRFLMTSFCFGVLILGSTLQVGMRFLFSKIIFRVFSRFLMTSHCARTFPEDFGLGNFCKAITQVRQESQRALFQMRKEDPKPKEKEKNVHSIRSSCIYIYNYNYIYMCVYVYYIYIYIKKYIIIILYYIMRQYRKGL